VNVPTCAGKTAGKATENPVRIEPWTSKQVNITLQQSSASYYTGNNTANFANVEKTQMMIS
jgi:hypothetical protein